MPGSERQQIHCFLRVFIFGFLCATAAAARGASREPDCVERDAKGTCISRHRLHHLTHHHEYNSRNVTVPEHLTLLHAEQPGVQLISSKTGQALQDQTLAAYVTNHIWAHTGSNKRFRKFLDGSSLFASTTAGSHPKLVEWYCAQTDALLEQPSSYLVEDSETRQWLTKDDEWTAVHKGYTSQMADSQDVDILLYGDSMFESTLGTGVGHKVKRAEEVPAVWATYRSGSNKKVMAILGDTTVDLMWRLLNGAMPASSNVKQVVLMIGSNNLLGQWFQLPEDPRMRPAAVAACIISICNLILATWPDTPLLLSGVLVGGVRGDWGEPRSYKLPNRYFDAATIINAHLMDWVQAHQNHQVSYVDCSGLYVIPDDTVPGGLTINRSIMNDTLHPNGLGFSMMLDDCFEPAIRKDIDSTVFPSVVWNS